LKFLFSDLSCFDSLRLTCIFRFLAFLLFRFRFPVLL